MNITTATPAEIDAQIAELNTKIAEQRALISGAKERIEYQRSGRSMAVMVEEPVLRHIIEDARSVIESIKAERSLFTDEWKRRGGWTRYFLVDSESGNGHVHYDDSAYRCSRTNTTRHYWLTEYSGATAASVVELAGERACTVCFPWAPVTALTRPTRLFTPSEIERAQARAERERKAAAKAEKLITNPDGSILRYGDLRERLATVVSAQRALVDIVFYARWYRNSAISATNLSPTDLADIERIVTALAHKRGTDPAAELVAADARYVAKCKREGIAP
jgi:hypothetical protein